MEDLLRNDFTAHYDLPVCLKPNLVIQTNEPYFEVEDTTTGEITLHTIIGGGMARFSNPNSLVITIVNYDKFVTSLPNNFQRGKGRCDIIVCDDERNLVLGEIKDSPNIKQHRKVAKRQLYESLATLLAVPQFLVLSNNKIVKRCCYFNKQTNSPAILTVTTAFNRLSTIFQDGFRMSHPAVEGHDFEFWEYLGGHTLRLT
ncbi:hypothetical protein QWY31_05905 [Cytophagales bacterium LB-30]|uniref:Type I restriction enzyme R protein N-terminal domain-containing protein n=1 Tax=Shiella aurantiaca TaxID=3058365 RepID=A0ABT8F3I3_9BACT|nr:hypothetical protein [Shiella aurantiaca]MDN4165027.1 hypothetical protein [Shiella aurantiaca]